MDNITPLIITALVVLIGGAIAVRLLLPKLILKFATRKLSDGEREAFHLKQKLLEHSAIVELYAPTANFPKDHDPDKKKRQQVAWLSPYPKAVKAAYKRPRKESKSVVTLVRAQIAAAAASVSVETLPDELQPANAGPEHFTITLLLKGEAEAKVRALGAVIKSQLGLHSLEPADSDDHYAIKFEGHKVAPIDKLTALKIGADFLDANPAKNPSSIPLAIKSDGSPVSVPMQHTLVLGMTGSGKGSPLNGLIRQLAPAVNAGTVLLYGADPKASELKPYDHSTLFKAIAYDNDKMSMLIKHVHRLMKQRSISKKVDIENANLGRSLEYTTETPLIVFIIDEFLSLLIALQGSKAGQEYITLLTEVLAQGRSLGVVVIAATQEADKELLGRMRGNFGNTIVLKQPSEYFNDLFLGQGAAAAGYDSTRILVSNKANGYASAGIGYVKEETGNPVRVRFAYSSDRDIADLIIANRNTKTFDALALMAELEAADDEPTEKELDESWEVAEQDITDLINDDAFSGGSMPELGDNDNDGALPPLN